MKAVAVLAALIGCVLLTGTQAAKCNCRCDFNYAPVCAVDSHGVEETYPNKCSFECYMCTHDADLRFRKEGECDVKPAGSNSPQTTRKTGGVKNPSSKCHCACPAIYQPVCAADLKGVEETYPNLCALECYKCTHDKVVKVVRKEACESPIFPPRKSQRNRSMNLVNKERLVNQENRCNCKCPFNYAPVCAVDAKGVEETFPNRCSFECYKCTHDKDYSIRKEGECSDKVPARPNERPSANRNAPNKPQSKCKCSCPFIYKPVCATGASGSEEEFDNLCSFDCYKCTHDKAYSTWAQGPCRPKSGRPGITRPKDVSKCNCNCLLDYTPLCGVDSRGDAQTFPNKCSLDCFNCTHKKDFVVRKQGECSQPDSSRPPRPKSRKA